jgi:lysophospholipase L1-like esterase
MLLESSQKVLFIGDSITDSDCRGTAAPYGNGYVNLVANMLLARYPERQLSFVNKGVSRNNVRDMAARWEQDAIAERPGWVSIHIGINDVWRHFAGEKSEAVPIAEYTQILRRLIQRTREATGARLVLMEPYMIEPNRSLPMRGLMDVYTGSVGLLAAEFGAVLVRLQAAWDAVLPVTSPWVWAGPDQIHPNPAGHALIALTWLKAVGFEL